MLRAAPLLLACALAAPPALRAQPDATPPPPEPFPVEVRAGLRLGAFEMVNAADSYDAAYGDPMPLAGGQVEWLLRPRWLLGASLAYGEIDGERVFPGDPPIPTGIDTALTYLPLHVTVWRRLDRPDPERPAEGWSWWLGAGPSGVSWEDDGGLAATADGTEVGGHAALSLRRTGARWIFGGELLWSSFPDAVGEAQLTEFFGEDDVGGLSLTFLALRRF